MAIEAGNRIGPYEIVGVVGAGGMGVVYRARDTRLGRDVALKVLPPECGADADRLRRFEQEARAAGSLNHPNVLTVHDFGTHEGAPFLVTELLEGQTLRERLREGLVPVRKALDWGAQIARGLAAAHDKGIVHRDLKPDNLFVTRDGRVKILDFGLARALGGEASGTESTLAATAPGAVLGTAGYMSPEQVRGKPTDARADIFSFGAVLYEMLTGKLAFAGDSHAERGYAILNSEPPDPSASGISVPPPVERLLRRCLEKSPDERFQSARDLAFALEAQGEGSSPSERSGAALTATAAPAPRCRWPMAVIVAVLLLAVGVGAGVRLGRRTAHAPMAPATAAASQPSTKFTRVTFRAGAYYTARFSPDQRSVVYSGQIEGEEPQVFTATLDQPHARAVSPPRHQLYAVSSREQILIGSPPRPGRKEQWADTLSLASLSGGAPREIHDNVVAADFAPDGTTLAIARLVKGGNIQVEYPQGTAVRTIDDRISPPRVSPKGDLVAFFEKTAKTNDWSLVVGGPGRKARVLSHPWRVGGAIAWTPDGREVWFSASQGGPLAIHAVTMGGEVRTVLQTPRDLEIHDIARDGRALVLTGTGRTRAFGVVPGSDREANLSWFDGTEVADLSEDGRMMLFTERGEAVAAKPHAFVRRTDGSPAIDLGPGRAHALSPDGTSALVSPAEAPNTLTLVPIGPGTTSKLDPGKLAGLYWASWFPDGKRVRILGAHAGEGARIFVQDIAGGPPRPITEPGVQMGGRVSPDGRYMAITLEGDKGAFLVPLDGSPRRPLAGVKWSDVPLQWSTDSKSIYVWNNLAVRPCVPARFSILDVATGKVRPWREFGPTNLAGVNRWGGIQIVRLTSDGKYYVYSVTHVSEDLYVAEGLR
jgi:eukaryotic-like serine/threonine-protein kinase